MQNWRPGANRAQLQQRAKLLTLIRNFFADRDVLEVETPALSQAANTDPVLHSVSTVIDGRDYYLHTSPEFAMKRLLAAGCGDIYQICKVYRGGESGRHHNPEFSLLEWYRQGMDYLSLSREVVELIQHAANSNLEIKTITYNELFIEVIGVDVFKVDLETLKTTTEQRIAGCPRSLGFNEYLDLLLSHCICPQFEKNQLTIVHDYPASQAALAQINADGITAARFEVFWGGLELANGFQELQDAEEQRQRFLAENQRRSHLGLSQMPVDENLLKALESGLPDCSGVALGLDRLLMCLTDAVHIKDVLTFDITVS